jgi:hypothetical protein
MIRYTVSLVELEAAVDAAAPTWRTRAAERIAQFKQQGAYDEASSIWSEVKSVYMTLQHSKCAYCERKLEGPPFGDIEHDVEHYRPKSSVKKWPPKTWPPKKIGAGQTLTYGFAVGEAWDEGYYLLAYHLQNYATACKVCNSVLKSNYFPVYGPRGPQQASPADLVQESPLLIYPLGDLDDDPEDLIAFDGLVPVPVHSDGLKSYRARVTIDFFVLERREHLREERAVQIRTLWLALRELERAVDEAERAPLRRLIERIQGPRSPHSSCAKAFYRLYVQDRDAARTLYEATDDYLASRGR